MVGPMSMNCLAENIPVGQLPDRTGDSVIIGNLVQILIFESLRNQTPLVRVVSVSGDLRRIDVLVIGVVQVKLNGDGSRKVEVGIQRAGPMPGFDALSGGELPDVAGAGRDAIETFLDAVALALHLGEGQVDFCDDARDVEAFRVANAAPILNPQAAADRLQAMSFVFVVVASL